VLQPFIKRTVGSILAAVLSVSFVCAAPQLAKAYSLIGAKQKFYYDNVVPFQWGRLTEDDTEWTEIFRQAANSWNTAQDEIEWGYLSGSSNVMQVYYDDNNEREYGRTQIKISNGVITLAWMEINQATVSDKSSKFKRSVATHELGHGLGLSDTSSSPAIMNQNRDRNTIYTPQADDVAGIKAIY